MYTTVVSKLTNGLFLNLGPAMWSPHALDLHLRDPFLLRPGVNRVPIDLWQAWSIDHGDSEVLRSRLVYAL